jgi:starvation-inducible DNA-binding protein
MKPTLKLSDRAIEETVIALNMLLADEYVLCTKIKNVYWNYSTPSYYELHKFFKIQYELLDEMVNNIVNRVHTLGYIALGTMKDFLNTTRLSEETAHFNRSNLIIQTLITDHETIIEILRKEVIPLTNKLKDLITPSLVTSIMEQHEKMAWMLSSFLSEPAFGATKHIRTMSNLLVGYQEMNIQRQGLMPEFED